MILTIQKSENKNQQQKLALSFLLSTCIMSTSSFFNIVVEASRKIMQSVLIHLKFILFRDIAGPMVKLCLTLNILLNLPFHLILSALLEMKLCQKTHYCGLSNDFSVWSSFLTPKAVRALVISGMVSYPLDF